MTSGNLEMFHQKNQTILSAAEDLYEKENVFPRILVVDDQAFNITALNILLRVSKIDPDKHAHKALNGM